jgi:signal transduction histidine kinase/CheY-like chemotaxis protein
MAGGRVSAFLIAATALAASLRATAPQELSLREAAARTGVEQVPLHEGKRAFVTGKVSAPAIQVLSYAHLGIHDGAGHGFTIEAPYDMLTAFQAGDLIRAEGVIRHRGGLPVLAAERIEKTGSAAPAPPAMTRASDLMSNRYLGLLVSTEGRVVEAGANTGGEYLLIGDSSNPLKIFLPRTTRLGDPGLMRYERGDKVRVTGLSSQYCPIPPFSQMYQVVVPSASSVVLVERSWLIPPYVVALLAVSLAGLFAVWWRRERRLSEQRHAMRALNKLSEEVLSAASPGDILAKLTAEAPALLRVTDVHLYIYRPAARTLERIAGRNLPGLDIPLDSPGEGLAAVAATSFRNRALLCIPDTSRSALFRGGPQQGVPRAVMLVPMLAQDEPMGVLALCHATKTRSFNQDEQAAAQHFGNQIATSLKLMEQRTIREQLFRSEKLAATGQLISGIVDQLEAPLEAIMTLAGRTLSRPADTETKRLLASIASEARRASEIVSRLMSFARTEKAEARPVEINSLLSSLMEFLAGKWKAAGIQVTDRLSAEPIHVLGFHGQLEQVFLNLFVHAEQAMANAEQRHLYISTSLLARRVLVAISYTGPESALRRDPFQELHASDAGELGLGVCRGIIQSHSGEIRFMRTSASTSRFEVELPVMPARAPAAASARPSSGRWTVLVVEPDAAAQRQLLVQLSAKGARVIPIAQAEEAATLVERVRFDVAFCTAHLSGANWLEFYERVRPHIGAFVLLTDGFEVDPAATFPGGDGYVLRKPIEESDLARVVAAIESWAAHSRGA